MSGPLSLSLTLPIGVTLTTGAGVPIGALYINGYPVVINNNFIVIGP